MANELIRERPSFHNAFNDYYELDSNNLRNFFSFIASTRIETAISNIFNKTNNAVSSIRLYPYWVNSPFNPTKEIVRVAGKQLKSLSGVDDVYGRRIKNTTKLLEIASFNSKNYSFLKSFVDLAPFTVARLHLPFGQEIDLPWEEISLIYHNTLKDNENSKRDKITWKLYLDIDYSSGMGTWFITYSSYDLVNKVTGKNEYTEKVILSKTTKIGIDIPWGSTNNAENVKNTVNAIIGTTIGVIGSIATKNPALAKIGIARSLSSGASRIIESQQHIYQRGGNVGNDSLATHQPIPYITLISPKLVNINEEEYAHTYGIPLNEERVLSTVRGFTIIEDIHLTGFNTALDGEVNEIETLLKQGVHF